jgi:hypothetical protein
MCFHCRLVRLHRLGMCSRCRLVRLHRLGMCFRCRLVRLHRLGIRFHCRHLCRCMEHLCCIRHHSYHHGHVRLLLCSCHRRQCPRHRF